MAVGEKEHEGTVIESGGEKKDSDFVPSAASDEKKTKKKGTGLLSRIWNGIFRVRGDDFEKRLKYISKEETVVRNRMKRRSITRRKFIRNLIAFSVFFEIIAIGYAIMTTRDEDLDWRLRSFRILPMFLLPALAFLVYTSLVGFWRMCDRRDQNTLEKLQAELLGKINELKERTNYYTTQQLIQRYDPDPAAKAAAATVLASKLGAESGLKVFVEDESQLKPSTGKSNDMEVKHSQGLRNRKQSNTRRNSGTTPSHHSDNESNHSGTSERMIGTEQNQQTVIEHYDPQAYAAQDGSWISRITALLVGEDPTQSYALICGNCRMHNGLSRKEDYPYITYYCPHCHALNKPKHSEEHSLIAPADTLQTVSLKPMEISELINSGSLTSDRGNSPVPLLKTPEIVEESPETDESETPN